MLVRRTACSRSGLVGNPSDIFGGKVISLLKVEDHSTLENFERQNQGEQLRIVHVIHRR